MRILSFLLALFWLLWPQAALAQVTRVVYPAYETEGDHRFQDLIELLKTALDKTAAEYGPYEMAPAPQQMNEARYLTLLSQGRIDIAWSSTSIDKERDFLPIRIPLRKGILGYRIALIHKEQQAALAAVKTAQDLHKFSVGQGIGWGDNEVYKANGIRVTQARYDNLFRMVSQKRFDLFPRGIGEVFSEYASFAASTPGLVIENHLMLYYPWPYYFFFNRRDSALARRIEKGLRTMIADGSFDANFKKYNAGAIEHANFKGRHLITLHNPLLPKETPLDDAALWFNPARDAH